MMHCLANREFQEYAQFVLISKTEESLTVRIKFDSRFSPGSAQDPSVGNVSDQRLDLARTHVAALCVVVELF